MELEYGTQIVLAIISSNALSALISGGIALFSQRRKKKDSNTAIFIHMMDHVLDKGKISLRFWSKLAISIKSWVILHQVRF